MVNQWFVGIFAVVSLMALASGEKYLHGKRVLCQLNSADFTSTNPSRLNDIKQADFSLCSDFTVTHFPLYSTVEAVENTLQLIRDKVPSLKIYGGINLEEELEKYKKSGKDAEERKKYIKKLTDNVGYRKLDGLDFELDALASEKTFSQDSVLAEFVNGIKDTFVKKDYAFVVSFSATKDFLSDVTIADEDLSLVLGTADLINFLTEYDTSGLKPGDSVSNTKKTFHIEYEKEKIQLLLKFGVPSKKILMGFHLGGIKYITNTESFLENKDYKAICGEEDAWQKHYDEAASLLTVDRSEIWGRNKRSIIYMNSRSIANRMRFATKNNLGGASISSILEDYLMGSCKIADDIWSDFKPNHDGVQINPPKRDKKAHPLLRTINEAIEVTLDELEQEDDLAAGGKGPTHGKTVLCKIKSTELTLESTTIEKTNFTLCTDLIIADFDLSSTDVKLNNRIKKFHKIFPDLKIHAGVSFSELLDGFIALEKPKEQKKYLETMTKAVKDSQLEGMDLDCGDLKKFQNKYDEWNVIAPFLKGIKEIQGENFTLVVSTSASKDFLSNGIKFEEFASNIDLLNFLTEYDTGSQNHGNQLEIFDFVNEKEKINLLIQSGVPSSQIVMGVHLGGPMMKDGVPWLKNNHLDYNSICQMKWENKSYNAELGVAILRTQQWSKNAIVYMDSRSVANRLRFAVKANLSGASINSILADDAIGLCNLDEDTFVDFTSDKEWVDINIPKRDNAAYPILKTINEAIVVTLDELEQEASGKEPPAAKGPSHGKRVLCRIHSNDLNNKANYSLCTDLVVNQVGDSDVVTQTIKQIKKKFTHLHVYDGSDFNGVLKGYLNCGDDQKKQEAYVKGFTSKIKAKDLSGSELFIGDLKQFFEKNKDGDKMKSLLKRIKDDFQVEQRQILVSISATKDFLPRNNTNAFGGILEYIHLVNLITEYDVADISSGSNISSILQSFHIQYEQEKIDLLINAGVPPARLTYGFHLGGPKYKIADESFQEKWDFKAICKIGDKDGWSKSFDAESSLSTLIERPENPTSSITFMNSRSIANRLRFAMKKNLIGASINSILADNPTESCGHDNTTYVDFKPTKDGIVFKIPKRDNAAYPMLNTINDAIVVTLDEIEQINGSTSHSAHFIYAIAAVIMPFLSRFLLQ